MDEHGRQWQDHHTNECAGNSLYSYTVYLLTPECWKLYM